MPPIFQFPEKETNDSCSQELIPGTLSHHYPVFFSQSGERARTGLTLATVWRRSYLVQDIRRQNTVFMSTDVSPHVHARDHRAVTVLAWLVIFHQRRTMDEYINLQDLTCGKRKDEGGQRVSPPPERYINLHDIRLETTTPTLVEMNNTTRLAEVQIGCTPSSRINYENTVCPSSSAKKGNADKKASCSPNVICPADTDLTDLALTRAGKYDLTPSQESDEDQFFKFGVRSTEMLQELGRTSHADFTYGDGCTQVCQAPVVIHQTFSSIPGKRSSQPKEECVTRNSPVSRSSPESRRSAVYFIGLIVVLLTAVGAGVLAAFAFKKSSSLGLHHPLQYSVVGTLSLSDNQSQGGQFITDFRL